MHAIDIEKCEHCKRLFGSLVLEKAEKGVKCPYCGSKDITTTKIGIYPKNVKELMK